LLVAPLLALVLQLGINELLNPPGSRPVAAPDLTALQDRLLQVRSQLAASAAPSVRTAALVERLEQLIQQVQREEMINGQGDKRP
jgi:hypothetical protein